MHCFSTHSPTHPLTHSPTFVEISATPITSPTQTSRYICIWEINPMCPGEHIGRTEPLLSSMLQNATCRRGRHLSWNSNNRHDRLCSLLFLDHSATLSSIIAVGPPSLLGRPFTIFLWIHKASVSLPPIATSSPAREATSLTCAPKATGNFPLAVSIAMFLS